MIDAPVIDLHVHYYTDQYIDAVKASERIDTYRRADGRLVARWRGGVALTVVDPHPGPAQRIEMMDELGIEMQVLSVPSPNAYFLEPTQADRLSRDTNEAFAEIVRAHPTRFSSLATAPLQDTDRALKVLDHAIDELGMAGIHILSNIDGLPLDDPKLDPFWESANDRGLLVYVHPTVPDAPHHDTYSLSIAVGFFSETPLAQELVFDTASKSRAALGCAAEALGTDRLVFGTDYPHIPGGSGPYLEALEVLDLDPDELTELLGGRARHLLAGRRI